MPSFLAIGNMMGASNKTAGKPSKRQPKIKNTKTVTAMKATQPPGNVVRNDESCWTTPLWVMAHAIADAVPKISKIAPLNAAVSTNMA